MLRPLRSVIGTVSGAAVQAEVSEAPTETPNFCYEALSTLLPLRCLFSACTPWCWWPDPLQRWHSTCRPLVSVLVHIDVVVSFRPYSRLFHSYAALLGNRFGVCLVLRPFMSLQFKDDETYFKKLLCSNLIFFFHYGYHSLDYRKEFTKSNSTSSTFP